MTYFKLPLFPRNQIFLSVGIKDATIHFSLCGQRLRLSSQNDIVQIIQQIHTHKKDVSKDKEVFKCTTVANASDYRGGKDLKRLYRPPPKKFKIKN